VFPHADRERSILPRTWTANVTSRHLLIIRD
jgi:hypothetical protein